MMVVHRRRKSSVPMSIPGATSYFRLHIEAMVGGEWVHKTVHNQPFATHEDATSARVALETYLGTRYMKRRSGPNPYGPAANVRISIHRYRVQ